MSTTPQPPKLTTLEEVTRLEIIDHTKSLEDGGGRTVIFDRNNKQVELDYQDDGRTLKVFVTDRPTTPVKKGIS